MDVPTPALKRPAVMSALAACIRGSQEGRGIHLDVFRHARHPDRLVVTQAPLEYLTEYGWVFPETESGGQIHLGSN